MFQCVNETLSNKTLTSLHIFPEDKSEHWIKPGLKFLFYFVYTLELKFFIEGILDLSFYHSINQKILLTVRKEYIFAMLLGKTVI